MEEVPVGSGRKRYLPSPQIHQPKTINALLSSPTTARASPRLKTRPHCSTEPCSHRRPLSQKEQKAVPHPRRFHGNLSPNLKYKQQFSHPPPTKPLVQTESRSSASRKHTPASHTSSTPSTQPSPG